MSDDIRTGRKARKILTIMAAVFAVAMMLAAPLIVAVDTDADLTKDEQGYCVTYTNPTKDQMPDLIKIGLVMDALMSDMVFFNVDIFEDVAISDDPITIKMAKGDKIDSDTDKLIMDEEVSADKITITITATEDGTLIDPYVEYMPKVFQDAAAAIKAVMGNEVKAGDVVKITGSLNVKMASQGETKYNLINDSFCVVDKRTSSAYYVKNNDLTLSFKHGSAEEVSIKLYSNLKGMYGDELTYEYESTPIELGTKYTVKDKVSTLNVTGDTYYTVKDKDYTVVSEPLPAPDRQDAVKVSDLHKQSSITTQEVKDEIALLPAAADNITVDKTYGGAESAFDSVVMDAIGNDILKIVLIIVGVVVAVIILIIILIVVLLVKKKKNQ